MDFLAVCLVGKMTGVKGRSGSGGTRSGAGRKPQRFTLKLNSFVLINRQVDGKGVSIEGGTITEITRQEVVISLKDQPGTIIKIFR